MSRELVAYLEPRREEMIESLRELVTHESPSQDKKALDALANRIAARLRAAGGSVEIVAHAERGNAVIARFFEEAPGAPALVIGHFDTVWPLGTLASMPFKVEAGRVHGPGTFDMKAGLVLVEFALRSIQQTGLRPTRPVICLFTADEEIGSPTGRAQVERLAHGAAYALVPEPPLAGGALKTARKGVGRFRIEIDGVPAHAGLEPEKGRSAVVEMAHQILDLQRLNDPATGTTVTVGLVQGGTTPNVVPASAVAELDVRVTTMAAAEAVTEALQALRPRTEGTHVRVTGGLNRPPMERTPATAALFEQARALARELGQELGEGSAGGGSDGNFTAAMGLPTLDGLGAPGQGAHAVIENVEIAPLPHRAALIAALLLELDPDSIHSP